MSAEFHEGDKLTFQRGTSRIDAKVIRDRVCFESLPGSADMKWMADMGWAVAWVEKAAPPLPITDGWYATDFTSNLLSLFDGTWVEHSASCSWPRGDEYVRGALKRPYTHLEPVSVTAKKVLDRVRDYWERPKAGNILSDLPNIAAEFGVE